MSAYAYLSIAAAFLHIASMSTAYDTEVCQIGQGGSLELYCAAGTEKRFCQFLSRGLYVDQSLLIKRIWEEKNKIFFISAPTNWGKDVNLAMLEAFFGIPENSTGERLPIGTTLAYDYFVNGTIQDKHGNRRRIYPYPIISRQAGVIEQALGQFPIIYLNFVQKSIDERLQGLRDFLGKVMREYYYHLHSVSNDTKTSAKLRNSIKICQKIARPWKALNATTEELATSVQILSEVLHAYYGKKVVILVNEYDQFLRDAYLTHAERHTHVEQRIAKEFYEKFTQHTFYSNEYLEKAVVTAVLPVAAALAFNTEDNLREHNIIDGDDIYQFFGFTAANVYELMEMRGTENTPSHSNDLNEWYGGFNCPNCPEGYLFSPKSVLEFTATGFDFTKLADAGNVITPTTSSSFIYSLRKYPLFYNMLISLYKAEPYYVEYSRIKSLNNEQCRLMNAFVVNKTIAIEDFKKEHCDMALAFLCAFGYVTVDGTFANKGKNGTHICVKFPNKAIKLHSIKDYLKQSDRV